MATQETKQLDAIISSRRALMLGGSALAALAMAPKANAAATVTSYTDNDILNFALNLEYLEGNFYSMAAFGVTIDKFTSATGAATGSPTAPVAITGVQTSNNATVASAITGTATAVPFLNAAVRAYSIEIALEEVKHILLLRSALGALAVAQPAIDISPLGAFATLAASAGIPANLANPYLNDLSFLVGSYVFETGVTAYHGAAPLIVSPSILATASSIYAVEAYHYGLIRTQIGFIDPNNTQNAITATQNISATRSKLSQAALIPAGTGTDDFGLAGPGITTLQRKLNGTSTVTATQIVNADANVIAFSRNVAQVLNIVTGGGGATAGTTAKGLFFPSGLNGLFQ